MGYCGMRIGMTRDRVRTLPPECHSPSVCSLTSVPIVFTKLQKFLKLCNIRSATVQTKAFGDIHVYFQAYLSILKKKKFWEVLIANFPCYDTDRIEKKRVQQLFCYCVCICCLGNVSVVSV